MRASSICRALIILLFGSGIAVPCTTVFTSRDDVRLAAFNLDCSNVFPRVWFVPSAEGQFGRFCYGTDEEERIAEGGMNERGLFIAVNALDEDTGWAADPELPDWEDWEGWYGSGVPDGILAKCATVDEAVAVFREYNLLTLNRVKFLMADAGGSSVIVEWTREGVTVVDRGEADHQVSSNFVTSDYAPDQAPCARYRIASELVADPDWEPGVDGLRRILSATHLEFQTPTVLSAICDLTRGSIQLYYFHDFENVKVFDLHEELQRERHGYLLADIFTPKPYVATVYEQFSGRS